MNTEMKSAVNKALTGLEAVVKTMQQLKAMVDKNNTAPMEEDSSDDSSVDVPPKPQAKPAKAAPKPKAASQSSAHSFIEQNTGVAPVDSDSDSDSDAPVAKPKPAAKPVAKKADSDSDSDDSSVGQCKTI